LRLYDTAVVAFQATRQTWTLFSRMSQRQPVNVVPITTREEEEIERILLYIDFY
jgi:hypothetical protein